MSAVFETAGRISWRVAGLSLGTLALGLVGCGSLTPDSSLSAAQIRFVEVSPGAAEMDFYVNGSGAAYGVGFANFTSYLPANPGPAGISATRAGTGQSLVSMQGTLSGGHQYTAVVSHHLSNLQERLYQDMDTPAPPGQVAVRILNEVEGAGTINFYLAPSEVNGTPAGPPSMLAVASGGSSSYVDLPAGTGYTVSATVAGTSVAVPVSTVSLKAGSGAVRTVVFAGTLQAGGHGVVSFLLNDVDVP